jgi:hypothetical protein
MWHYGCHKKPTEETMKSLIAALALIASFAATAAEPSIDMVYQQAQAGHMETALNDMAVVLQNHPNSAKAHYVYADLLAKSGQYDHASAELSRAENLAPGLPFVTRPGAVTELKQVIATHGHPASQAQASREAGGTPWGMIFLIGGLALLLVIWLARRQAAQNAMAMPPQYGGNGYYPPGAAPMGGVPPYYPGGGGMGSGLMGSLATGAALGAGMVAGEALASHLMDGNHPSANPGVAPTEGYNDMGGQDFGIGDSGSWDSGGGGDFGGGGGGGDWS